MTLNCQPNLFLQIVPAVRAGAKHLQMVFTEGGIIPQMLRLYESF